jgi:hypothetical protein
MEKEIIKAPSLILLGSAGRNAGKTVAACALIEAVKKRPFRLVALKVTSVDHSTPACHRGGEGCGACSFEGAFVLEEQTDPSSAKDTSRLLAAGADRVFWLRAKRTSLASGFRAFLSILNGSAQESLILGESNSLREAVKPGLFIMLKNKREPVKNSAGRVAALADLTLETEGVLTLEAAKVLASRLIIEADGSGGVKLLISGCVPIS